jgi:hypothetical protein
VVIYFACAVGAGVLAALSATILRISFSITVPVFIDYYAVFKYAEYYAKQAGIRDQGHRLNGGPPALGAVGRLLSKFGIRGSGSLR